MEPQVLLGEAVASPDRTGNIIVKNLDPSVDTKTLYAAFSPFGAIQSCKVPQGKNGSKRHGFVHFTSVTSASVAVDALNGSLFGSKKIYVSHFQSRKQRSADVEGYSPSPSSTCPCRTVYLNNVAPTADVGTLKLLCTPFGEVSSIKIIRDADGSSKGFAFISFKSPEEASKAIHSLNGQEVDDRILFAGPAKKRTGKRPYQFPQTGHPEPAIVLQQQPGYPQEQLQELFQSPTSRPVSNGDHQPPSRELDQPYQNLHPGQIFQTEDLISKHHQQQTLNQHQPPHQHQKVQQLQNHHHQIPQQPINHHKSAQQQQNLIPTLSSADKEVFLSTTPSNEKECDSQRSTGNSRNNFISQEVISQIPKQTISQIPKQTGGKENQELTATNYCHHDQYPCPSNDRLNGEVLAHLKQQPKPPEIEIYQTAADKPELVQGTLQNQQKTAIFNQNEIQVRPELPFQEPENQSDAQPTLDPDSGDRKENSPNEVGNHPQQQAKYVIGVQNHDQQQQTDNNVKLQKQTQTPNEDQTMKFQLQRYQPHQHQQQAHLPPPFFLSVHIPGSVCPLHHSDEFHPHFYHQQLNQARTAGGAVTTALPHMDLLCIPQCHFNTDLQHSHNVMLCGDTKQNQTGYEQQPLLSHVDWQIHQERIQGHLTQQHHHQQQQQQQQQQKILSFPNPYLLHPLLPANAQSFPQQTAAVTYGQNNAITLQDRVCLLQQCQNQPSRLAQPHQQQHVNADNAAPNPVPQGVNLYVKHLDEHVDDSMLRKMFSRFGEVVSAKVMMEGNKSRGFGFVCFARAEDAARATRDIRRKGDDINKKQLYVAPAQRKEERQAFFREKLKSRLSQAPCGIIQENDPRKKLTGKEINSPAKNDPEEEILTLNASGDEKNCPEVNSTNAKDKKTLKLPDELISFIKGTGLNPEPCRSPESCLNGVKSLQLGQVVQPKRKLVYSLILECLDAARLQTPLFRPSFLPDVTSAHGAPVAVPWPSEAEPIPSAFFDHGNEVLLTSLASVLNPLRGKSSPHDLESTIRKMADEFSESSQDQPSLPVGDDGDIDIGSSHPELTKILRPIVLKEPSHSEHINSSFYVNENQPKSASDSLASRVQPNSATHPVISHGRPRRDNQPEIVIRSDPVGDYTSKEWTIFCDALDSTKTPVGANTRCAPHFQANGLNRSKEASTDEFLASVDNKNGPFNKRHDVIISPVTDSQYSYRFKNEDGQLSCSPVIGWSEHPLKGFKRALSFSDSNSWGKGSCGGRWRISRETFPGFHRQSLKRRWCSSFDIASGQCYQNWIEQCPWPGPSRSRCRSHDDELFKSFPDEKESALFAGLESVLQGSSQTLEHEIRETSDVTLTVNPLGHCSSSATNPGSFHDQIWEGDSNFLSAISCMTSDQQKMLLSETVKSHVINLTQTMWKEQDERIQPFLVLLVDNWATSEVVEKLTQMILELDVGEILNCLLSRQTLRSLVKEGLDQMLSSLSKYFDITVAFTGNRTIA